MHVLKRPRAHHIAALAAVALTAALSGCGSDGTTSSDASTGAAASKIKTLTSVGLEADPPKDGPAPATGKSVWWIACGMVAPDCAIPAETAKEAAAKLGIDFHIVDGKLNQAGGYVTAMQTALAAKPDAIIVHAQSCDLIKAPLDQAKKEGIITLAVETTECADQPRFTADMQYAPKILSTDAYFKAWGEQAAQYIIAATDGKARVIDNAGTDSVFPAIEEGFKAGMDACSDCKIIDSVSFTAADQIPDGPWIQSFQTSLVKNPTANAVFIPSGYMAATLGGAKAAKQANPSLNVVSGGSGTSIDMDATRSGEITAVAAAHDANWMAYAAMDSVNRLLQGQELVPEGVGIRAVNKDANLPEKEGSAYSSPIDWKSAYESLWSK